ncbi:MAG: hypothetical protein GTN76_15500 [Candidatus Aenigmarchaeota archaeon]|nr:hypothetical protein [Candidatus Aenigmarchaeota archaeon]
MFRKRKGMRFGEFRRHLLNARKEVLLGVKSIIDFRIRGIEKKMNDLEKMKKKVEKIPVESA